MSFTLHIKPTQLTGNLQVTIEGEHIGFVVLALVNFPS